jgi:hypothetical protein
VYVAGWHDDEDVGELSNLISLVGVQKRHYSGVGDWRDGDIGGRVWRRAEEFVGFGGEFGRYANFPFLLITRVIVLAIHPSVDTN